MLVQSTIDKIELLKKKLVYKGVVIKNSHTVKFLESEGYIRTISLLPIFIEVSFNNFKKLPCNLLKTYLNYK